LKEKMFNKHLERMIFGGEIGGGRLPDKGVA